MSRTVTLRTSPVAVPVTRPLLATTKHGNQRFRTIVHHVIDDIAQLTPRDEEITQLRELIRRIETDVSDVSEQDQARIAEAITVIRKTRQVVNLGMPTTQPPSAKTG